MRFQYAQILLLGIIALCVTDSRGEEHAAIARWVPSGQELPAEMAKSTVESLWASREELHSGVCQIMWHLNVGNGAADKTARCAVYFDYDRGLARVDRTTGQGRAVQRIDTPQELVVHVAGARVVSRFAPRSLTPADSEPIDPRMAGLMELGEFEVSASFSQLKGYMDSLSLIGVVELPDAPGSFVIAQESVAPLPSENAPAGAPPLKTTYRRLTWVDASRRFSPTRMESWVGVGESAGEHMELQCRSDTTWEVRGDAAVPIRCAFTEKTNPRTVELLFSWESVNEPVADALFTAEALVTERPSMVVNHRFGTTVIERIVQREDSPLPPARANWLWWAAIGLVPIVALGIAAWRLRHRSQRAHGAKAE